MNSTQPAVTPKMRLPYLLFMSPVLQKNAFYKIVRRYQSVPRKYHIQCVTSPCVLQDHVSLFSPLGDIKLNKLLHHARVKWTRGYNVWLMQDDWVVTQKMFTNGK